MQNKFLSFILLFSFGLATAGDSIWLSNKGIIEILDKHFIESGALPGDLKYFSVQRNDNHFSITGHASLLRDSRGARLIDPDKDVKVEPLKSRSDDQSSDFNIDITPIDEVRSDVKIRFRPGQVKHVFDSIRIQSDQEKMNLRGAPEKGAPEMDLFTLETEKVSLQFKDIQIESQGGIEIGINFKSGFTGIDLDSFQPKITIDPTRFSIFSDLSQLQITFPGQEADLQLKKCQNGKINLMDPNAFLDQCQITDKEIRNAVVKFVQDKKTLALEKISEHFADMLKEKLTPLIRDKINPRWAEFSGSLEQNLGLALSLQSSEGGIQASLLSPEECSDLISPTVVESAPLTGDFGIQISEKTVNEVLRSGLANNPRLRDLPAGANGILRINGNPQLELKSKSESQAQFDATYIRPGFKIGEVAVAGTELNNVVVKGELRNTENSGSPNDQVSLFLDGIQKADIKTRFVNPEKGEREISGHFEIMPTLPNPGSLYPKELPRRPEGIERFIPSGQTQSNASLIEKGRKERILQREIESRQNETYEPAGAKLPLDFKDDKTKYGKLTLDFNSFNLLMEDLKSTQVLPKNYTFRGTKMAITSKPSIRIEPGSPPLIVFTGSFEYPVDKLSFVARKALGTLYKDTDRLEISGTFALSQEESRLGEAKMRVQEIRELHIEPPTGKERLLTGSMGQAVFDSFINEGDSFANMMQSRLSDAEASEALKVKINSFGIKKRVNEYLSPILKRMGAEVDVLAVDVSAKDVQVSVRFQGEQVPQIPLLTQDVSDLIQKELKIRGYDEKLEKNLPAIDWNSLELHTDQNAIQVQGNFKAKN